MSDERILTAFRFAGRAYAPGPCPADMSPDALAWARGNGLLAAATPPAGKRKTAAVPGAPRQAVKTPAGSK